MVINTVRHGLPFVMKPRVKPSPTMKPQTSYRIVSMISVGLSCCSWSPATTGPPDHLRQIMLP